MHWRSASVSLLSAVPNIRSGALQRFLERVLVPPLLRGAADTAGGQPVQINDDFTRVVGVVALVAVGFFAPSLLIANVPMDHWLMFLAAAGLVGLIVGGSFVLIPRRSRLAAVGALINVVAVAAIAWLLRDYYHELILLFVLVVAAHSIVHGIYPALVGALLGSVLVPFVIQSQISVNATDPVYALIYLTGAALVPWTAGKLAQRRAAALHSQLDLTTATEREAVMILARAAEAKDHSTGDHVVRVGDIAAGLALRTGMTKSAAEDLRFAGMLHDVGKLHLPDSVLQKPGPLNPEEWAIVQKHTIWGERILGSSDGFELARRVARSHHENFDGSGYPDGLRGDSIPLAARIVRVADVFDALMHSRPYKEAWTIDRVLEEIRAGLGSRYDPELAREMIAMVEADPALVVGGAVVGSIERRALPTRRQRASGRRQLLQTAHDPRDFGSAVAGRGKPF